MSKGAMAPTLAAVGTLFYSIMGLTSNIGASVNTKPTLSLHKPDSCSNCGSSLHNLFLSSKSGSFDSGFLTLKLMAFLMMVFFPTIISPFFCFLKACLISYTWFDPTFSKLTMSTCLYLEKFLYSLDTNALFLSKFFFLQTFFQY